MQELCPRKSSHMQLAGPVSLLKKWDRYPVKLPQSGCLTYSVVNTSKNYNLSLSFRRKVVAEFLS